MARESILQDAALEPTSTAISQKGFMLIFTFFISTPLCRTVKMASSESCMDYQLVASRECTVFIFAWRLRWMTMA